MMVRPRGRWSPGRRVLRLGEWRTKERKMKTMGRSDDEEGLMRDGGVVREAGEDPGEGGRGDDAEGLSGVLMREGD
ncbi:hypothetical protein MRB53_002378 [Persea americana]|uniref:Uncharacterized protein n=1 Tax=Persea americana TaxID=3435 RepID=A0ACC2MVA3_PERAE|nr:hypothetical protein MRB53_002378 [Persea americana]